MSTGETMSEAATPQVRAALRDSLYHERIEIGRRQYADHLRLEEIRELLAELNDAPKDG
jgi:hypothetical protein